MQVVVITRISLISTTNQSLTSRSTNLKAANLENTHTHTHTQQQQQQQQSTVTLVRMRAER